MDINRNNYEEYFLLYADNELTDSEKAEVLMFLKQNKDLEVEFRMIHHTICKPDATIGLTDKSFLLKGDEAPLINEKNYEEVFVLYHDNELDDKQKKETEQFLSSHTQLQNEFELIGLARLAPEDAVIFPNKKILYKKEKAGKVVPVIFWRMLAAAIFIGFGLWITALYIQKGQVKPGITAKSIPAKQVAPAPDNSKTIREKKPVTAIAQPGHDANPSGTRTISEKEKLHKSQLQKSAFGLLVKSSVKAPGPAIEKAANKTSGKTNDEMVVTNQETKNIPEELVEDDKTKVSKELAQNTIEGNVNIEPVKYAQNAFFASDPNDNSQNYVFYDITTEEFKKTKVGGFLKKVKRLIERNNPISRLLSGDERQVVSN